MNLTTRFLPKWHLYLKSYNETLLEGCLDERFRTKLKKKIQYHHERYMEIALLEDEHIDNRASLKL
ncbi:hypothetical protein [Bacillus sp. MUM 13]|uniref:hypothetical protein n=1 Tax=Bacillus sp. MUM 13 TaxID=1678001 RepID=UPI0008F5D876|nr:hypothetical protein [Bacillus sp. MUM 13]OIK08469.1 hypothetical protein BIV59_19960 [Bacillus sp. MUM 13]